MRVSQKQFNMLTVSLGVLAVLLLPFWPYSRWGYFPACLAVTCVAFLLAMRALSRPS